MLKTKEIPQKRFLIIKNNQFQIKDSCYISDDKSFLKVRLIGVEPIIFGTEIQRFIQLSYKRIT